MNLLIFGPPGAGKGTQSTRLAKDQNMKHISTGDLFRNAIKNKTKIGLRAQGYLDQGNLVPDEVVLEMVKEVFAELKGQTFILDGFPRTVPQADGLGRLVAGLGLRLDRALFLTVEPELLVSRLSGRRTCGSCGAGFHVESKPSKVPGVCDNCGSALIQRSDDQPEVIRNRLEVYNKSTSPLKEYYSKKGILREIDGFGDEAAVYSRINNAIKK
ncbi:MAG: adenylate kinase [Bdellovibrionales bacterium]|nr:adenylate kinase [Bdellovibrionales bacterium]